MMIERENKKKQGFLGMTGLKLSGLNFIKYFYTVTVTIKIQSVRSKSVKEHRQTVVLKTMFNQNNYIYGG